MMIAFVISYTITAAEHDACEYNHKTDQDDLFHIFDFLSFIKR